MKSKNNIIFKTGAKLSFFITITTIIVILINVLVNILPSRYTRIDTTKEKLFTLSKQTVEIIKKIDKQITIYHLCAGGIGDENITELLKRYASINDKINISVKDTSIYPNFSNQYTDLAVSDNSLIVESEERSKVINYYDIYQASNDEYAYYGYYDIFNGETLLTGALDYVTSKYLPKLYIIEGHSEQTLPTQLTNMLENQNFEIVSISLPKFNSIPQDADAVLLISPSRDISENEYNMLKTYLEEGGKILITTDYNDSKLYYFNKIIEYYNLKVNEGIVLESNGNNHIAKYPYFIYPQVNTHEIIDPIIEQNLNILFPLAQGMTVKDYENENVELNEFIYSSETSYSKIDINSKNLNKTDEDIDGPFTFATTATMDKTKAVIFSTSQFLDSNINNTVAGANYDLFTNAVAWLCDKDSSISVHSKNMYTTSVAVPKSATTVMFILMVILIPITVLALAIIINKIRKSR